MSLASLSSVTSELSFCAAVSPAFSFCPPFPTEPETYLLRRGVLSGETPILTLNTN